MHEEQGRLQPSRRKQPKSKVSLAGAQAFRTLLLDLSQIHLYACGVDHPRLAETLGIQRWPDIPYIWLASVSMPMWSLYMVPSNA